ncbi:Peflin [Citrus sinensis]|uniref:Peflin n=1 Tax=Citrus sinensis TaxID=2711 RepID=A0ACB8IBL6_CITSI|nr:Peflin [Citrus sinensis]
MYDFDRTGTMSFEEFVELNKFLLKVQHAFSDLERGRGYLVPDNVYEVSFDMVLTALVKIGFSLDSPAFYTVCELPIVEYEIKFLLPSKYGGLLDGSVYHGLTCIVIFSPY